MADVTVDNSTAKSIERDYQELSRYAALIAVAMTNLLANYIERLRAAKAIQDKSSYEVEIKIDGETVYKGVTGQNPTINKLTPEDFAMIQEVLKTPARQKDIQISVDNNPVYKRHNGVVEVDNLQQPARNADAPKAPVGRPVPKGAVLEKEAPRETTPSQTSSEGQQKNSPNNAMVSPTPSERETTEGLKAPDGKSATENISLDTLRSWYTVARSLGKSEQDLARIVEVGEQFKQGIPVSENDHAVMKQDFNHYQERQQAVDLEKYERQTPAVSQPDLSQGRDLDGELDVSDNGQDNLPEAIGEEFDIWELDSDGDGLSDYGEQQLGTNPYSIDTDGDGVIDPQEIGSGSNPRLAEPNEREAPSGSLRNLAAIVTAENVLDKAGKGSFEHDDYHFERQGKTITVMAKDGRGAIAQQDAYGKVTGSLSAKDVAILSKLDRAFRTDKSPSPQIKGEIQGLADKMLEVSTSPEEFARRMKDAGVDIQTHSRRDGSVIGISYQAGSLSVSGARLGKDYSWNGIERRFQERANVGADASENSVASVPRQSATPKKERGAAKSVETGNDLEI